MQEERRQSDREWFEKRIEGVRYALLPVIAQGFDRITEKLNQQAEVLAIPTRDIPTVEELLEQAKGDTAKRKLLQTTLAELEFADTEIEYP